MAKILDIAKKLISTSQAIKTIAAKSRPKNQSALTKLANMYKKKKLTKEQMQKAEDLEDIADKKYNSSRKKGVSLAKLLASIDRTRKKNALRDKVTVTSIKRGKAGNVLLSRSLTYDKSGSKVKIRPHKHIVKQIVSDGETDKTPISKCKRISFYCDCEDFAYRWQYALTARWGCSEITTPEVGQFPVMTNPSLQLGACKHAFVLLTLIRNKGL